VLIKKHSVVDFKNELLPSSSGRFHVHINREKIEHIQIRMIDPI
jgi:hypothetical protein